VKRVNIHLDEELLKQLDELLVMIKSSGGTAIFVQRITRADLIRLAIGMYFNLDVPYIHCYSNHIEEVVNKILKKSPPAEGV